ncbi:ABC-type nitrate/sulfonate/bicarbonate transport systems periplasmic components-like protein [Methanocorpusculum labreanum Z]|uniref:ABC-type nitrate/sulfonate/bicarbonate transport systems periplasmic components-like protein n=2 Tax=Methanocorpusculum labreanum TaxID=83984 RepID=A2SQE6_METLZ|nr:ABC-type nitrate/sulfonate/bicarbonate transport systems periplasmic components-like protein [Methanocorpusculum labreanum Z]
MEIRQHISMQKKLIMFLMALLVCVMVVFTAGCTDTGSDNATVEILYTGAGTMPGLLATGQIDGYINWQPFVAVALEGDIGKVISYSQDLPPKGTWTNHTCCVFGANSKALENPEIAASLSALMILGNKYINDNPDNAAVLTADWLFSSQNMTYGNVTVSSIDVMKTSIPTIKFSSEVTESWMDSNQAFILSQRELGLVTSKLATTSADESAEILYDFGPYESAVLQVESGTFITPAATSTISIGYLPSDHHAPLFVLLKDWEYFKDTYNCYLKPVTEKTGKITDAELYTNGQKIADVKLVEGTGGPQLMTLLQQNAIQYALAGTPPFISAVDKSTGDMSLKILSPIMLEGSGLVASVSSPANDWNSFVSWVKSRSAEGKNVVLGDPQLGSIQDVQLKAALESAGIVYVVKSA